MNENSHINIQMHEPVVRKIKFTTDNQHWDEKNNDNKDNNKKIDRTYILSSQHKK